MDIKYEKILEEAQENWINKQIEIDRKKEYEDNIIDILEDEIYEGEYNNE